MTSSKFLDLAKETLTSHASSRRCSPNTALFLEAVDGALYRHMGEVTPVLEWAWDQVRLNEVDHHLDKPLALYSTKELERFKELQLLPTVKDMVMHRHTDGLCVGDGSCPANAVGTVRGGVYSFDQIQAETEKAVDPLHWVDCQCLA